MPVPLLSPRLAAPGLLIVVGALLAVSVIISKLAAAEGLPMLWFLAVVMTGAGALLCAMVVAGGGAGRLSGYLPYAFGAGTIYAGASALGYLSVGHVGAGYVALTFAFPILFTWILALLLGMERPGAARALGVAAALAGGLMLARAKLSGSGPAAAAGWVAVASCIPLLLAAGNIYRTRFWPRGAAALPLAGLSLLVGGVIALPVAAAVEGAPWAGAAPLGSALPLALAAILTVAAQNAFQFRLQALAGPVYMSQIGSVAAVVGAAIAVLWLGEGLPPRFWPAAGLIAVGVAAFTLTGTAAGRRAGDA